MANPFTPNQQPIPGNGQYPTGQQFGGGYGQSQGYGQQAQQGYYPQGQFQASPYGGQPEKKTGLIIGIIAAVVVVILVAGVAIWWFVYNDDSSDDAAAQSTPSTAAPTSAPSVAPSPSAPVAPAPAPSQSAPPVGTKPSPAPTQGTGSSGSVSSDEEYGVMSECKSALSQTVQQGKLANWTVTRDGVDSSGRPSTRRAASSTALFSRARTAPSTSRAQWSTTRTRACTRPGLLSTPTKPYNRHAR